MHKNSFHNCSMTIFNYLKIVRDLNQKSMNKSAFVLHKTVPAYLWLLSLLLDSV